MTPFSFHTGINYETSNDEQWKGTCPFCEKEGKLWFNKENLWDCKNAKCVNPATGGQRSGNLHSFLKQVYDEHETATRAAQIVSDIRQIPKGRISQLGLKYNPWNDSILIPTFRNGKLNNLYKAVLKDGKFTVLCTPTMEHTLFNYPEDPHDTVWVIEGHWDRLMAEAILNHAPDTTAIAVPGAGVWKSAWTPVLADRNVVFCYDNDDSGRSGFEKVIRKHIASSPRKPKSISFIDWSKSDEALPPKFDLSDAYLKWGRKTYEKLEGMIEGYKSPENTVVVRTTIETVQANKEIDSWEKLKKEFHKIYHVTHDMEYCLLLCLTSVYSVNVGGEQLWLRVIGPPGCGKTTIVKALSASDQVVLKSTFTGLFSGWHDDKDEDASMVPMIAGRTLAVKDADALLKQANVERIFSELRDFYDRDSSTQYRNRKSNDYRNISSTMILCGTNVLRRSDQSFLGERFLDFEMRMNRVDQAMIEKKMMQRTMALALDPSNLPPETPVQAACKGFIEHLMDRKMTTNLSEHMQDEIMSLARLTAAMRTNVDRDMYGKGDVTFAPVQEIPTRLIGQLGKLCACVPIVTGDPDETIAKEMLYKVVHDILDPTSNRFKLCMDLMEDWFTRNNLVESTGMSKSQVNRELDDLRVLRLVEMRKLNSTLAGHKTLAFTLREDIKEGLMKVIKGR